MVKGSNHKYNLNSAGSLRRRMNEILVSTLAEHKYFQSRWLIIFLGLSKIFHACALMYLYMWPVTWDEKFYHCFFFLSTASLNYLI